jgi:glutamate dehydrogenase
VHGKIPPERQRLIARIAAQARQMQPKSLPIDIDAFIHAYYRGVAEEDLAERRLEDLAGAALRHLELGLKRQPGRPLVRIFNADSARDGFRCPHTLALIVTDDMPFLVDSLNMVFSESRTAVHLIVHPVLSVQRKRSGQLQQLLAGEEQDQASRPESWQLYEIDRQVDATRIEQLRDRLEAALNDVRVAVEDWMPIRQRVRELIAQFKDNPPPLPADEVSEARSLLDWMEARHFVFVGYRHYRLERGKSEDRLVSDLPSGLGILRTARARRGEHATTLRGELRQRAREPELLILTKANSIATIHRQTYLDYVGLKTFDKQGRVNGEHRFLGLWTSTAYYSSPQDIPVLRRKVAQVIDSFGLDMQGHDGKALLHVLETFPRDELFQASADDLARIVRSVVSLYERRTVRLLARRDPYGRFYSCLVYVPRDRYNSDVRHRIERLLLEGVKGTHCETQVQISDSHHARVHVVVRVERGGAQNVDFTAIEQRITRAATTWSDRLRAALIERNDEAMGLAIADRYNQAFPLAYQEDVEPEDALHDIADLEALRTDAQALRLNLYRPADQSPGRAHFKIVKLGEPVTLSEVLPTMENFGLRVIAERPYELTWPEGGAAWVQDFELEHRDGMRLDIPRVQAAFKEAYALIWSQQVENDGFHRLLLGAGLTAREIVVLRAYCRYLLQTGLPFSHAYMEQVLTGNARISGLLARKFLVLFDPAVGAVKRARELARIAEQLDAALTEVNSQDEDRILRAFRAAIGATLRTNYFQGEKPYLSIKLDSEKVPELPLPRPMFEIFVYSPRVEGIHLRKGRVARGGLRWSDRREDFRTEVLGLMKAQVVKNTVIVPVGAKGGFVPKRLPLHGGREDIQREVVYCYETFVRGLLDLTDNIADGRITPPPLTVRRDEDDPYLVVAADKGTATFSDLANRISAEYDFWLGDAFASGGSAGYDHKKMAITARGAWECVKRHFRELGLDTQRQPFTVIGVGDMSGDVFGNGMLQSPHIRLLAAFNHQHIFIDPDPDPAAGFAERQRLFDLPRSSWEDYDRRIISRGGGVYARAVKSISLSPEAQRMLGLKGAATSQEIIKAILKLPADLFWNGGIGTYVKASSESHAEIGDRSNDSVRIDGEELRCRIVGEGGNLGLSQRGRIEYALNGGRMNTDFIDNSGGVNCSDVEVNIKILLNGLMQGGQLTLAARNRLLAQMTAEVAELVLRNNYLQGQAISTLQAHAAERFREHVHVIRVLAQSGELNPAIEFLPDDEEIGERRKRSQGLTRPELAIVLSYSKIWLYNKLLNSDVPEDPYLSKELERYFPAPILRRFGEHLGRHRLRREIISTATTNSLVNRMGPVFALRAQEDTGAGTAAIARAYTIAREVFDMRDLWTRIEALDNRVPAATQYAMMYQTSRLLRHMTYWFLTHHIGNLDIEKSVSRLAPSIQTLAGCLEQVLAGSDLNHYHKAAARLQESEVSADIATRVAALTALHSAPDIVEVAQELKLGVQATASTYFALGERLNLDWIREQIEALSVDGHWQAVARGTLRDNLYTLQRQLTVKVLKLGARRTGGKKPQTALDTWLSSRTQHLQQIQRTIADMRSGVTVDFPTLSVALQAVRRLAEN